MRDGLAAGDRVQLHINNGKKKAYIRDGLDWIKRFPVGGSAAFCPGRGEVCCWHLADVEPALCWVCYRG